MHTLRLFFLALLVCLGAAHTVQAAPFVSVNGYSITPAPHWAVNQSRFTKADVIILTQMVMGVRPNFCVLIAPAPLGQTLEQAQAEVTKGYSELLPQGKLVRTSYETVDNVRGLVVVGTYLQGVQRLAVYEVMVIKDSKAYTFVGVVPEPLQAQYAPAFAQMLRSVRWSR